jgi:hypothetical protein
LIGNVTKLKRKTDGNMKTLTHTEKCRNIHTGTKRKNDRKTQGERVIKRDKQKDRKTERQKDRKTERQKDRKTER